MHVRTHQIHMREPHPQKIAVDTICGGQIGTRRTILGSADAMYTNRLRTKRIMDQLRRQQLCIKRVSRRISFGEIFGWPREKDDAVLLNKL